MCHCMENVKWFAPIAANTLATVRQEITNQVAGCISFSLITNATGDNARNVNCREITLKPYVTRACALHF